MFKFESVVYRRMLIFGFVFSALALTGFLTGCSKAEKLENLDTVQLESIASQNVKVNFCTDPAQVQKQYLKTIVILDHSGSNQKNYLMNPDGSGAPALVNGTVDISSIYATDPTGKTRYGDINTPGTLLNYLHNLPPNDPTDPTRFFALIDFNSSAQTYPVNSSGFTSNITDFYNHVQADATAAGGVPSDGGATSYLSALTSAYTIISNDIQLAKQCAALPLGSASPGQWCPTPGVANASSYVIVFMSDGSPITSMTGVGVDSSGNVVVTGNIQVNKEPTNSILGQVQAIAALSADTQYVAGVNLFTIYYYHPGNVDASGQQLLAQMAKVGNGIAYNALSGSNINYAQFQPPSKLIKYKLSDIFVTNANVVWWKDGKLHLDSDMDGLPDDVEIAWGSDPRNPDTQGNGVSDYVRYIASNGAACSNKNAQGLCMDAPIDYANGICSGIKSFPDPKNPGAIQFASSDPDGLNDCEKIILNDIGGINNPDSNSDGIPDWLELVNGIPFQIGRATDVQTADSSGYSLYQKVKFSLPTTVPMSDVVGAKPSNYDLQLVSTTPTQDCYNLTVTGLPTIGDNNTVRVDAIMKSNLVQGQYLYHVGEKAFSPGVTSLQFNDWNDPAEKAAGTWRSWP